MQEDNKKNGRVLQWKYTSSKYNIEQSTGFFTFSKSKGLTDDEKNELVDKVAHYDALESLPKRPTQEELKSFPVAFSCFRLSSGRAVLCRTQYIGQDYASTRYGNFFTHALILQNGDWVNPLCYFNSSTFSRELTQEEVELGRVPDPLEELALGSIDKTKPLADIATINPAWFNIIKRLVDRFYDALKNKTNLVIYLDEGNLRKYAAPILSMFLDVLPEDVRKRVGFCTYVRDATYEPLINVRGNYCFIAFAPSTSKEMHSAGKYISVDLSNLSTLVKQEYKAKSVYARRLTCDFLKHVVSVYPNDASSSSSRSLYEVREDDLIYMDNVGYIDELLHGQLSNFEAVEGVWKYLWELLKRNSVKTVQNFISTVLNSDYRKIPFARDLVREILAFSVRIADYLFGSVDNGQNLRLVNEKECDNAYREVCRFWRYHIPHEESAKNQWRTGVRDELKAVFGGESIAAEVSGYKFVSVKSYLQTFMKIPSDDFFERYLTLALGFRAAIEEPQNCPLDKEQFKALYKELSNKKENIIETDFFQTFATEICKPETYDLLCSILRIDESFASIDPKDKDNGFLRKFVDCPEFWRIGRGVPLVAREASSVSRTSSFITDEYRTGEEDEQEQQLVFADAQVDAVSTTQRKSRKEKPTDTNDLEPEEESNLTRFPGADALVRWAFKNKRRDILEHKYIFGTFTLKDFRHAKYYFKRNYQLHGWKDLEDDWYGEYKRRVRNLIVLTIVILILGIVLYVFKDKIYDLIQNLWVRIGSFFKES